MRVFFMFETLFSGEVTDIKEGKRRNKNGQSKGI